MTGTGSLNRVKRNFPLPQHRNTTSHICSKKVCVSLQHKACYRNIIPRVIINDLWYKSLIQINTILLIGKNRLQPRRFNSGLIVIRVHLI